MCICICEWKHISHMYIQIHVCLHLSTQGLLNAGTGLPRFQDRWRSPSPVRSRPAIMYIYICHYMSTLALSQMPEASHLLCRKPNAGIQAQGLCSLRALHIFSIFMYSCICQSMIWSFSYNDTLQCLIVFTEPTNLYLCTYTYILNCCHLRRYFFLSNYYTTGQEVSKWHWVSILLTQNIAWFRKLAKAKLTKDPWKKTDFHRVAWRSDLKSMSPHGFSIFSFKSKLKNNEFSQFFFKHRLKINENHWTKFKYIPLRPAETPTPQLEITKSQRNVSVSDFSFFSRDVAPSSKFSNCEHLGKKIKNMSENPKKQKKNARAIAGPLGPFGRLKKNDTNLLLHQWIFTIFLWTFVIILLKNRLRII